MQLKWILVPVVAAGLAACGASEEPESAEPAAAAAPAGPPSFRGDIPMNVLMQGPVTLEIGRAHV